MIAYRITTAQCCKSLTASGNPARWSSKGKLVLYTASSRSLACLENLVHRSGEGDSSLYKVMLIEVPDKMPIKKIDINSLKKYWHTIQNYPYCQAIGALWLQGFETAILQVPSVIIKKEYNYLLNPNHPDFKKIKLISIEDFDFDQRF